MGQNDTVWPVPVSSLALSGIQPARDVAIHGSYPDLKSRLMPILGARDGYIVYPIPVCIYTQ